MPCKLPIMRETTRNHPYTPCQEGSKLNWKASMKIQILSRKFIKPSTPTPHHLKNMNLSFIDQLAPSDYPPMIFYYPADSTQCRAENVERRNRLEKSLSETLTLFYPLAGRFIRADLLVDCNDDGVEYLEAQVHGQLAQLLHGERDAELLSPLVPFANESGTSPLVVIQINVFDCGGLVIGVRISHKIADGFTYTKFINGWATASRVGIKEVIRPSFNAASFLPAARDLSGWVKPRPFNKNPTKFVMRRFVFDGATILSLKAKAKAKAGASGWGVQREPSNVDVVMALIWRTSSHRCVQAKYGHLRPSLLGQPMNLRGKTSLAIPDNCCGNLYRQSNARFMADESKMKLHDLVSLLQDAKRNSNADCEKMVEGDFGVVMVIKSINEFREEMYKEDGDVSSFASLCGFPLYEVDFGWGKPGWVSRAWIPFEHIVLMDTKCRHGIEAWVSLDEKIMLQFL